MQKREFFVILSVAKYLKIYKKRFFAFFTKRLKMTNSRHCEILRNKIVATHKGEGITPCRHTERQRSIHNARSA